MRFFGPHETLRHGGRGDREGRADGGGVDSEHGLQHQRGTDVRGDGGVGAHQHELQPTVGKRGRVGDLPCRIVVVGPRPVHPVGRRFPHVPQPIPCHSQQPCFGIGGDPVVRPPLQRSLQGIGQCVLGRGDVSALAGQQREQSAVGLTDHLREPHRDLHVQGVCQPRPRR